MVSDPSQEEVTIYAAIVHAKDTHVLAGAHKAKAEVLITLDRKHICAPAVRQAEPPFEILTPGALLRRLVVG